MKRVQSPLFTLIIITLAMININATGCSAARGTDANTSSWQVDTFTTPGGKTVTITAIKHGSLAISCDGLELQIDPVAQYEPPTDYSQFPTADVIIVTHEHSDHYDPNAIATLSGKDTRVITNHRVADMLGHGTIMANGDTLTLRQGVTLQAVPAYNTTPGRDKFHPRGRDNGFIITLDGLRLYVAGDCEVMPEMQDIHDIDVAFLPCNQPYTMTPQQLNQAARLIKPRVLFPYHYSDTDMQQVQDLLRDSGIDVRIRNYQ